MECDEQSKLSNKIETESWMESRLTAVREEGLGVKGEEIKQKQNKTK